MNKKMQRAFYGWMEERHAIYCRRARGEEWPWTDDPILREYKFTNVFRQLDRTSVDLADILAENADDDPPTRLFRIIVFRLFNWTPTYDTVTRRYINRWNTDRCLRELEMRQEMGQKIFTGAYVVTNEGLTIPKVRLYAETIGADIKPHMYRLAEEIVEGRSLEYATDLLTDLPLIGPFVAYEIVTDLRHTDMLNRATDIYTWANPGPGAQRGCNRIFSPTGKAKDRKRKLARADYVAEMRILLEQGPKEIDRRRLEMRDIEHSLCEFDKYMRVKLGEGKPRSRYKHDPRRAPPKRRSQ